VAGGRPRLVRAQVGWSCRTAWCLVADRLAGGAGQPAERVYRPARPGRPGPVVGLAERGRVSERCPAAWHVAPGGGQADLITEDAALGDRDREDQRIEALGLGAWRPRADGPEPGQLASPARHPDRLACLG
jgi:hypothetical protein